VSTLKKKDESGLPTLDGDDDIGLGIENGTFKWNEVEEREKKSPVVGDDSTTAVGSEADEPDHRFELKDIDIRFPEGQLSLITGPTASGKSALLVSTMKSAFVCNYLHISFSDGVTWGVDTYSWRANYNVEEHFQG
jgi:hypothetical protein